MLQKAHLTIFTGHEKLSKEFSLLADDVRYLDYEPRSFCASSQFWQERASDAFNFIKSVGNTFIHSHHIKTFNAKLLHRPCFLLTSNLDPANKTLIILDCIVAEMSGSDSMIENGCRKV